MPSLPAEPGGGRLRFAPFEFDAPAGELYRDGQRIRLQEQPRQILAALLERPGDLVTREELRLRVWNAETFVDFEHGLNTAVKKLRHALGDSAETPCFIETLPRRGYRFVAPVEPLAPGDGAPMPSGATTPRVEVRQRGPWRRVAWVAMVCVMTLGAGALWRRASTVERPAGVPGPSTAGMAQLAVLPFRVVTDDGQDAAYLGIGLADAITTRLAATRRVRVRPTSAVLPLAEAGADPARAAASLRVLHLVAGTIHVTEAAYRISVQLVAADGTAVWGRTFDEPRAALAALQDRLAGQIVEALRMELAAPVRGRVHARYTGNPGAYDLYLRGRALLVNYTEAKMHEAISAFEQALRLDPGHALARTGIATASAWFSVRYAHDQEAIAWGARADREARRALEQDAALADAHLAIASAAGTVYGGFDWTLVLDRSAEALALDPSLELGHLARMRAFYHLGLFEAAAREGRAAEALNPGRSVEQDRLEVALLLQGGQYEAAATRAEALLAETDAPVVRHYLGLARYYAGDAGGGRTMLASVARRGRPDARAQASLASIEAATGMRREARARVAAVVRGPDLDHHVAYSLGAALAQLGDPAASLTWLERAADTGFPCYPWFERDSLLDPVRDTPRFTRLMERLRAEQGRPHAGT